MQTPKVLVTGSHGFIGRHLMKLVPDAVGWDIEDNPDHDICQMLPDTDFTHIFHLAASKSVSVSEMYPRSFILNNCFGTVNLLKEFPRARVINVSSSAADECKSVYGMTKYFAELAGYQHKNCLNVRLYNVFGEGQNTDYGAVVPNFITAKLTGSRPIIYGDGTQTRDLTYVGDVVDELYRLMFATNDTGLTHIGYGQPILIIDLCREIFGPDVDIQFMPKRNFDIEFSCALYPMQATYGRKEGLRRTIQWWKDEFANTKA